MCILIEKKPIDRTVRTRAAVDLARAAYHLGIPAYIEARDYSDEEPSPQMKLDYHYKYGIGNYYEIVVVVGRPGDLRINDQERIVILPLGEEEEQYLKLAELIPLPTVEDWKYNYPGLKRHHTYDFVDFYSVKTENLYASLVVCRRCRNSYSFQKVVDPGMKEWRRIARLCEHLMDEMPGWVDAIRAKLRA